MNEMKQSRYIPIYVLSGALIFVGIISSSQAQAVWTSKETARIKALESKIQKLENQASNLENYVYEFADELGLRIAEVEATNTPGSLVTLRFLAVGGSGGTFGDICPGAENLDFGGGYASYVGKLTPKTNLFDVAETNAVGQPITRSVYACKIQFYVAKK